MLDDASDDVTNLSPIDADILEQVIGQTVQLTYGESLRVPTAHRAKPAISVVAFVGCCAYDGQFDCGSVSHCYNS